MKTAGMKMSESKASETKASENYDRKVAKGAGVNLLGNIGKLLFPLYWVLLTRLFGPEVMGLFLLASVSLDIVGNITISGFHDGVLMFASRAQHGEPDEDAFYRVVANGFVVTFALCGLIIGLGQLLGPALIAWLFPGKNLWPVLVVLLWALPITGATTIAIAATKSLLLMHWDALLVNTLRPLLLVLLMVAWYAGGDRSPRGLAWSYLFAVSIVGVVTAWAFSRHFSFRRLWHHVVHFSLARDLIRFALPQNINMTFHNFITQIDVVMLGIFKFKNAQIGFYGIGAQIVSNLSQVQGSIAGAYAPAIARQHKAGDSEGLNESFTMVSRWAVTATLPLALAMIFFRPELLKIFHGSFAGASMFMVVLALRSLVNSGFGISGNIIVMTGHSLWNLFNSVTVAMLNIGLNALLIPRYGLVGAAAATAISSVIVTGMQLVELYLLLGVRSLVSRLYKPYLSATPAIVAVVLYALTAGSVLERSIAFAAALASYVGLLVLLGIEPEDKKMFFSRWQR